MSENEKDKKINVTMVLKYLNYTFSEITKNMDKPWSYLNTKKKKFKSNEIYRLQTEFAYLLHDITNGPECLITHNIAKANAFLDSITHK